MFTFMPMDSAFQIVRLNTFWVSMAVFFLEPLMVGTFSKFNLVSEILSSMYLCTDVGLGLQMADVIGLGSSGMV